MIELAWPSVWIIEQESNIDPGQQLVEASPPRPDSLEPIQLGRARLTHQERQRHMSSG